MEIAMKYVLVLALGAAAATASAEDCGRPPVTTATHAICLAEQYAKRAHSRELTFEAKEQPTEWLVSYAPKDQDCCGDAGDLKIEKASGKITWAKAYR